MSSPARLAAAEIRLGWHHYSAGQRAPIEHAQFIAVVFEKDR
jgi:hypothetical protein